MPNSLAHPADLGVRPVWMEIDLVALANNYRQIERLAKGRKIIAAIKADAYGHGAVAVARELGRLGCPLLGTGSFAEALAMRAAGIDTPILMFGGYLPEGMASLRQHRLIPTVHSPESAQALARLAGGTTVSVYVEIDGGLGRLGVPMDQAVGFVRQVAEMPGVNLEGVYTHTPFGNEAGKRWALGHLSTFERVLQQLQQYGVKLPVTQANASPGLLHELPDRCNAVCPGQLLYGFAPVAGDAPAAGFQPVARAVRGRLVHVQPDQPARAIGSGGGYALAAGHTTGVIPFGLADGNRNPAGGQAAHMLWQGRRARVVGVSLEHCTLDFGPGVRPRVGDVVTILGEDGGERIGLGDLAAWQGVRPIDVLMTMSGRLPRQAG